MSDALEAAAFVFVDSLERWNRVPADIRKRTESAMAKLTEQLSGDKPPEEIEACVRAVAELQCAAFEFVAYRRSVS